MSEPFVIFRWSNAFKGPAGKAKIRSSVDDFIVNEQLGFDPMGIGEHVFLQIEKCAENTDYVARELARFTHVDKRDIGYAGLKDRQAKTTQWFSVWLPGKPEPDWTDFETDNIKIIKSVRHSKKLKRGSLRGNEFTLTVRNWIGDKDKTHSILESIRLNGIPNYFGSQRFGMEGGNVNKALAMFRGVRVKRHQRGLYLSAVRSFLFNSILSHRVEQNSWNKALPGDVFSFDQSRSYFKSEKPDQDIIQRLDAGKIHPTGVMWGIGESDTSAVSGDIENQVLDQYPELTQGLIRSKVEISRRALGVNVENVQWNFISDTDLRLTFSLPAGSYATSVLREIIEIV